MIKGSKKENRRVHKISIRLTDDEYNMFIQESKKNNMTISEYIRYLVKKNK